VVNPLAGEVEVEGDLSEGLASFAHLENFRVSCLVRHRARLERAPLPSRYRGDLVGPIGRKHAASLTLPGIADPGAKVNLLIIEILNVGSRNSAMPFTAGVLLERPHECRESLFVCDFWFVGCHAVNTSSGPRSCGGTIATFSKFWIISCAALTVEEEGVTTK
jgi:hypothetical protein